MEAEQSTKPSTVAKLKVGGAYSGVLEVELEVWTVPMLREEVAKRSDCDPLLINLICGGKVLRDGEGDERLSHLGVKNNSKILATRVSAETIGAAERENIAEEERSRKLARIKAAADALAKRHADGSLPMEDFNIELEDQSGQKVQLGSENDQQSVMMGLMLHANAKRLIKKDNFKDALNVLEMGEEAFSLCNPKVLAMVDNVPILQIDTVWCYFMLRDITKISSAGIRLVKARDGLERSHGKDSSRFTVLQEGRHPELALYVRLELLEGVVAYHSGQFTKSRKALDSARYRYSQLQVPDEALSVLMSMGYKEREAKRALRINNQDVGRAVHFLVENKGKIAQRVEEDFQRRKEIKEQKKYGTTPLKKAVDLKMLLNITALGFDKELAAEALRTNENDFQKALDDLTNPETCSILQFHTDSRKFKRQKRKTDAAIEELVSMGFERSKVVEAMQMMGTKEEALDLLTSESMPNEFNNAGDVIATTSAPAVSNGAPNEQTEVDAIAGPSEREIAFVRDVEMEDEIAQELTGDPFADYDIEVTKEGEAIIEYLALLESVQSS
ncbi:hypothetical protein Syun_025578 [Stephania yunnanensis]|uniref:UBA domain-containing protein n=1 Tax=Stephania yunnanensis TaxID=152371 RepID=A0AAP0HRE0_9MAGN